MKITDSIKKVFSLENTDTKSVGNIDIDVTPIDLINSGKVFPPVSHRERIDNYKRNKQIFKGNHFEVFKDFNGSRQHEDLLYVSSNLASVVCKKSADFLFGETAQFTSAKGENSKEEIAIDRIVKDNNLNILTYECALSNAYRGDSFIKVRYGQEFGGELPKEIDIPRAVIETVNPEYVFPETSLYNRNKIVAYHIAVPVRVSVDDKEVWQLFIESHYAGRIEERVYNLKEKDIYHGGGFKEVITWDIGNEIISARSITKTGVNYPLVVHVPNFATDDSWEGIDDITEHLSILEEINNRLTQIASILDKHADPSLVVPSGVLGEDEFGNPTFHIQRDKVFEVMGKDDVQPKYITWEGQLSHAFKELEVLTDMFLTAAEIPSVALGRNESGTSGSSGLAIKWRMNSLLAKINRKRQYFDKALKMVIYLAQELEQVVGTADYETTVPRITFQDGLPTDETEQATVMSIRTGGMKTLSQKTAIMRIENMTEEQADLELERIKKEEEEKMEAQVDIENLFNKPSNENLPSNDTEVNSEGKPVTDKAVVKEEKEDK